MSAQREHFSSRIGFILAAAGSAVGIGNLVGFPVNAAKNGGGAFLVMYAIFVVLICLPVMMAEMAAGRKAAKDPVGVYKDLSGNSRGWGIAGLLSVITPFMIAVFYTVLTIWIMGYLSMTLMGKLDELTDPNAFSNFLTSPYLFVYMLIVGGIVFFILSAGVKEGIEKAAKILMPSLFVLLIGLVIFVLTLDNAMAGIEFYLIPDFSKLTPEVINGALSQAFFSLSLGMGILITYGSYITNQTNIGSSAKMVAVTDTAVAFIAGLMILPAVFSFNPNVNTEELSGSSVALIFVFLPKIFLELQASLGYFGASFIAATFFLLVFFAAITSLVSIIEVPVSYLMSEKNHSRKKALYSILIVGGGLSVLTALSSGMVPFLTEFVSYAGASKSLFDVIYDIFYDTILPLNGLLICLFVVYRWKRHNFSEELAKGNEAYKGSFMEKYVNFAISTFIPLILAIIFINTVLQKYFAINIFSF